MSKNGNGTMQSKILFPGTILTVYGTPDRSGCVCYANNGEDVLSASFSMNPNSEDDALNLTENILSVAKTRRLDVRIHGADGADATRTRPPQKLIDSLEEFAKAYGVKLRY